MDPDRLEWSPFKGYSCGNTRTSGNCLEPVGDLVPAATQQQCNHLPLLQRARTNNRQGKITYSLDWQWIRSLFDCNLGSRRYRLLYQSLLQRSPGFSPEQDNREAEIEPILNLTVASENSLLSLFLVAVDDSGWEAREDHHIQGKGLALLIESMHGVHWIDDILLASFKYGKRQLVMNNSPGRLEPIRNHEEFWMNNNLKYF